METTYHRPMRMTVYREKSASVQQLMERVAKAMAEFTPIVRDGEGEVVRNGKRVKYRYATLDSLHRSTKPALLKYGVVPLQEYCVSNEGVTLVTTLAYGDQFISSTLPIRQYEDQQRLKAHKSYMRRTAYEALLCLSAEDDGDGAEEHLTEGAAAEPTINGLPARQVWRMQNDLAVRAIEKATTPAEVEDTLSKVRGKIAAGDMDPHCIGRMEEVGNARIAVLKAAKTNGKPAKVSATQEVAK